MIQMANFKVLLLFTVVFCATLSHAQFHVDVTMPANDKDYIYEFESVSCNGKNCTASARLDELDSSGNSLHLGYDIVFFRSTDGGLTWKKQDPGFPKQGFTNYTFNQVQQIDSLNVVAIADTGLILRSYDAGNTWEEILPRPTSLNLSSIHFSDLMNGILVTNCDSICSIIFTSKDGGKNWTRAKASLNYAGNGFYDAKCFGDGKYAVLPKGNNAPLFLTADDWKTVKRIETYNVGIDSAQFIYRHFKLSTTLDTILVAGQYFGPADPHPYWNAGIVRRSIDGGASWGEPLLGIDNNSLQRITGFERNTLVAMGPLCEDTVYISTDLGETWRTELIKGNFIFEGQPLNLAGCYGIASSSTGIVSILGHGFQNCLAYHPIASSDVNVGGKLLYLHRIYPNPVSNGILSIASIEESTPYRITDMLGRVALSGMVGNKVDISVDVSHLSPGIYFVYVDDPRLKRPIRVGKVSIIKH